MDWKLAGQQHKFRVDFTEDEAFIIPDPNSIFITIRDHTGSVMTGYSHLSVLDSGTTNASILLPQSVNMITVTEGFEARYVTVEYASLGTPLKYEYRYRLTPFLLIQKDAADVRNYIGATSAELPASAIDMIEAYYKLTSEVGAFFVQALSSKTRASICANNMVALQAAIAVIPSLQSRLLKTETSNNESYARGVIDFEKLEAYLLAKLSIETTSMFSELSEVQSSAFVSTSFVVSTPTDIITG